MNPNLRAGRMDPEQAVDSLERRERWGFSDIVVAADVYEAFTPVVERLAGT